MSGREFPPFPCCGGVAFHRDDCSTEGPAIWDLVIADMRARDRLGTERYGTRLYAHDGRDMLRDAYEEALDMAVYLRKAIAEREGSGS